MYNKNELVLNVSYDDYAVQPGLRSSWLKELKKSPAHLQASLRKERNETPSMRRGKLFHSMIENAERFMDCYLVEPEVNRRTNAGKEELANFYATVPKGTIVLKPEEVGDMTGMAKAFISHKRLKEMLVGSVRESSLWVDDPDTGELLKCRPDLIAYGKMGAYCCDIKTCTDSRPEFFSSNVYSKYGLGYALQCAHYVHCLKVAKLTNVSSLTIIAIETSDPYGIHVYPLDMGQLDGGERYREKLTRLYAECKAKNEWPCYEERFYSLELPQWADAPKEDM